MRKCISEALLWIGIVGLIFSIIFDVVMCSYSDVKKFNQVSEDYFKQINSVLEANKKQSEIVRKEFNQLCIVRARAAAYMVQQNPELITNQSLCRKVAKLLQVDEIHFFSKDGVIFGGTNPDYYDLSMDMGEQIGFFKPILDNPEMEMCQELTENTAENKMMQYAAVWCEDGSSIVQIGMEPERVLEAIKGNNISDVFTMISTEKTTEFYAIDMDTNEILGAMNSLLVGKNAMELGFDVSQAGIELHGEYQELDGERRYCVTQQFGPLVFVRVTPMSALHDQLFWEVLWICICVLFVLFLMIMTLYFFLERRIIRSFTNINEQLRRVEQGDYQIKLQEDSMEEFRTLCKSINSMTGSLLHFSGKISRALELSELPIGICEYDVKNKKFVATSRVSDILKMTAEEFQELQKNTNLNAENYSDWLCERKDMGEHVFSIKKFPNCFIRLEQFSYDGSTIAVLIDITRDINEKNALAIERDTDILTGLYNRRAFYRVMDSITNQLEERKDAVIILCDLDHLKRVNDEYGHLDGNSYILAFSDMLHEYCKHKKIAARMGGDEFLLVVYGLDGKVQCDQVIDWIISNQDQRKVQLENGDEIFLEYSVGYSYYMREDMEYTDLIKQADERMYQDKKKRKSGR